MALPRFQRLDPEHRARILAVARTHIARDGREASYNQLIADAGISKASAYQYFDGKADLFAEVRRDLDARLSAWLGPWRPARSERAFWKHLRAESARLRQRFVDQPDELAVLAATAERDADGATPFDPWFDAVLHNGRALGVVRDDVDPALMLAATRALFAALDARELSEMHRGGPSVEEDGWELLRALWAPRPRRSSER